MSSTNDWSVSSATNGAAGGVPSSGNIGYFGTNYAMGARTAFTLDDNTTLRGIVLGPTAGSLTLEGTAGKTLTLGSSGITYNSGCKELKFNCKLVASSSQNWAVYYGNCNLTVSNVDVKANVTCQNSQGGTLTINGAVTVSAGGFNVSSFQATAGAGSITTTNTGTFKTDSQDQSWPLTLNSAGNKSDESSHSSAGFVGTGWDTEYLGAITLGVDPVIFCNNSYGMLTLHNIGGAGGIDFWYGSALTLKGTCTYEGATLFEALYAQFDISGADMSGCNTAITLASDGGGTICIAPGTSTFLLGNSASAGKGASLNLGSGILNFQYLVMNDGYLASPTDMNYGVATTLTLRQGSSFAGDGLTLGNNNLLYLDLAGAAGSQGIDNMVVGGASATASATGTVSTFFNLSSVATNGAGVRVLSPGTYTVISATNGDLTAGGATWVVGAGNYWDGADVSIPPSKEYVVNRSVWTGLNLDKDYRLTLNTTPTNVTLTVAEAVQAVPIHHYDVEPSSYSVAAGVPFRLTVTARNEDGSVVSNATSSVSLVNVVTNGLTGLFVFDGDGDGTYDKITKNLVNGTFTINVKGTQVVGSPWQIRAVDEFARQGISGEITINPGPASTLVFIEPNWDSISTNPPTVDGFNVVLQARDAYGNITEVVSNTVVTLGMATGTGELGGVTNGTMMAGTHELAISGVEYRKAEADVSLLATSTSGDVLATGTSMVFTVYGGAPAQLIVTKEPVGPFTAGYAGPQIAQPIIEVRDKYGNMTGAGKVVYVSYTPGHYISDVRPGVSRGYHSVDANGVANFGSTDGSWFWVTPPMAAQTGLRFSYTVDSVTYDDPTEFVVNAGMATYVFFRSINGGLNPVAGKPFPILFWSTDNFTNGSPLSGNRLVTVSKVAGTGVLGGTTSGTISNGSYQLTISNITYSVGETGVQFTVNNTGFAPWPMNSDPITVNRAVGHFHVDAGSPQQQARPFSVSVTAHDAGHNVITEDSQTVVTMTSSGATTFDGNGDGTFGDNTKTLSGGTLTITAKDEVTQVMTVTATGGGTNGVSGSITVLAKGAIIIVN